MKVVHKFVFEHRDIEIYLDKDAKVVLVGPDPKTGKLAIWIERDNYSWHPDLETRLYTIVGTGHPVPSGATHIGSVIQGAFVWHVYQL